MPLTRKLAAPLIGGAIGALVYRFITPGKGVTEPGY